MEAILVITNLPDRAVAEHLSKALIEQRLAACVNILAPCTSVYRWHDKVETAEEVPLVIKTLQVHYHKVEAVIRNFHPYELPEIISVPISGGLPAYLDWVAAETSQK